MIDMTQMVCGFINKVCYYYMENSEANAMLNKKIDKLRWAIGELYKEDPEKLMQSEENMKKLADIETGRLRRIVAVYEGLIMKYYQ